MRPKARESDIVIQDIEDEILIYDLISNKAYCLNETSAAVWQICDGTLSVSEITSKLRKELDSSFDENLVLLSLEQLAKDNLLEETSGESFLMNKVSRRDLIQKAGATSLIALPLISSIVAPKAAHAQSMMCPDPDNNANLGAIGCDCNQDNDCISTCCGQGNACFANGGKIATAPCEQDCECINSCDTTIGVCI